MKYECIKLIEELRLKVEANRENLLSREEKRDSLGRRKVPYSQKAPAIDRFVEKILINQISGCWEWQASLTDIGYGEFKPGTKHKGYKTNPHRFIYQFVYGEIPDDLEVDHLCRNRRCANPYHLDLKTHQENMAVAALDRRRAKILASKQMSLI